MKKYIVLSILALTFISGVALAKEKDHSSNIYVKSVTALVEPLGEYSDGFTTIEVTCDNNDAATGGAYKQDSIFPVGQQQNIVVRESYPITANTARPTGWSIVLQNLDGAADNYTVSVLCLRDSKKK